METKNNPHILVVDDEEDIREILQFNLEYEGFVVETAGSAEQAMKILTPKHDLILLDVMMGGMSGFKMADQLRKIKNNIPIIFLTAKDTENDILTGFSTGADDYISKPFSIKEVIARVKSILKRIELSKSHHHATEEIIVGNDLKINTTSKTVYIGGEKINLTKTEYNILTLLAENENRVFSRNEILERAWQSEGFVLERTVDVHIARLRKKIDPYGDFIINRSGHGYMFSVD